MTGLPRSDTLTTGLPQPRQECQNINGTVVCACHYIIALSVCDIRPYNKMLRIILLISVGIIAANAIACPKNYCDDVCCTPPECSEDEILVKKGGFCGCCDVCRTIIREGEPCPLGPRGIPPSSQCEEGTTCKSTDDGLKCVRNCKSE
ncbi:uncharacterized protein TNCV_2350791 [Trichonephila clavipes]|uniref:Uncharacterized protein n=1 Tax=Trichonephila clavipes TaxID=2585209 RepID=A0A8X6SMY0_TRICX|nr:uncharacterized protein TNCV_2350791 [Trichonephila clavipes]